MAIDGSDVRPLTGGSGRDVYPTWFSDGQWVAFHSNWYGAENYEIYVVPVSGGAVRQLTTHAAYDIMPDWSP